MKKKNKREENVYKLGIRRHCEACRCRANERVQKARKYAQTVFMKSTTSYPPNAAMLWLMLLIISK